MQKGKETQTVVAKLPAYRPGNDQRRHRGGIDPDLGEQPAIIESPHARPRQDPGQEPDQLGGDEGEGKEHPD